MGRDQMRKLLSEPTTEERLAEVMLAYNTVAAQRDRYRAALERVEEAVQVIYDTRHALPPLDASECVVLLRRALDPTEAPHG